MNLEFAMDPSIITACLERGNIALCPIRGIGKTIEMLNFIFNRHSGMAIIVTINQKMADLILEDAAAVRKHVARSGRREMDEMDIPKVIPAARLNSSIYGERSLPIFFDEYMELTERERFEIYRLAEQVGLRLAGGVASFTGRIG